MNIDPDKYWEPHTRVRIGHIDPIGEFVPRPGEAGTASRRFAERVYQEQMHARHVQITPGSLVVWGRSPMRVVQVEDRPDGLWSDEHNEAWQKHYDAWVRDPRGPEPTRDRWRERPVLLKLENPNGEARSSVRLCAPASRQWRVLPEHYAACIACGELSPCQHEVAVAVGDRETSEARVRLTFAADACMGCGEVITDRGRSVSFPGPNLWRPDLPGRASFHARKDCAEWVDRYQLAWVASGGESLHSKQLSIDGDDSAVS